MIPHSAEGSLIADASAAHPVSIEQLTGDGGVIVLAPHADDETLGCGTAIAAAVAAGRRVVVVLVTDGGASHPHSASHPRPVLVSVRAAEFAAAVKMLGGGAVETVALGLADSAIATDPQTTARVLDRLASIARRIRATAVWASWGGDPHCDHEIVADHARALADRLAASGRPVRLWSYAVWGRFGESGAHVPAGALRRFEAPRYRPRKRAAIRCYPSQFTGMIDDDPSGFVMPPALLDHFAEFPEIFIGEQQAR